MCEWQDDKRHGQGTYTYASGEKYVGDLKDDNLISDWRGFSKQWMTALWSFRAIKQSDNFWTVFDLSAAAVRNQELHERVHARKIFCVVDFALMAGRCQDARAFQNGQMAW